MSRKKGQCHVGKKAVIGKQKETKLWYAKTVLRQMAKKKGHNRKRGCAIAQPLLDSYTGQKANRNGIKKAFLEATTAAAQDKYNPDNRTASVVITRMTREAKATATTTARAK